MSCLQGTQVSSFQGTQVSSFQGTQVSKSLAPKMGRVKNPHEGYIYILMRADFIAQKKYIYKIGETTRFPPHKRLWDYPYGSVFLTLFRCRMPLSFESKVKKALSQAKDVTQRDDIGAEYYEGNLQTIINTIKAIYPTYAIAGQELKTLPCPINEHHILILNRIHYVVNYDDAYFQNLFKYQYYLAVNEIKSEIIYESYQQARQWDCQSYPENYVIRCGLTPQRPYHV